MSEVPQPIKHTNRLARESSPYLLQHAHNPVDWYAWGPEAFEAARKENKPIFLSVGYSTCYWCHVMERECFENEAVAAEMNRRFVNIKVDREERPDVDQLYMLAVQVLTRHGGWPMSVFMSPDLRPFYGGTYFPPTDMNGRPGFVTILKGIEDAYRNRPADVAQTADRLGDILRQFAEPAGSDTPIEIDQTFVEGLIRRSVSDYDSKHGGFGGAPKFPRETLLELLLVYTQNAGPDDTLKSRVAQMVRHTLDALAEGGIRDQLGGGFHRYSTDAHWLVPHFEIMLYDNAMLAWCYVEGYRQTQDPRYQAVARGIFDFVLREMTSDEGLFYTAMDAEVDSQEGLNYLWTKEEVERVLKSSLGDGAPERNAIETLLSIYGLNRGPNFADPHHGDGVPNRNILYLAAPISFPAGADGEAKSALLDPDLAKLRQILYDARRKRKQPLLDTKIITSWNALMIRALAYGGEILRDTRYIDAARRAADELLTGHRTPDGGLYRTSRDGAAKYQGFLDDYAFFIHALLALVDATGEDLWNRHATDLASAMVAKFGDPDHGGFFFSEKDAPDLIIRQKTASDSPLPSGNAIAAMALLQLGQTAQCRQALSLFARQTESQGEGMSAIVQAMLQYIRKAGPFSAGTDEDAVATERPLSAQEVAHQVVGAQSEWRGTDELHLHLKIADGFHVNAHDVSGDPVLIATSLNVVEDPTATVDYPPGEELKTPFADGPIRVYGGNVELVVRLSKVRHEGSTLRLRLTYQACDDSACLMPLTKEIVVERPE
ncbi:MAG TPA: DUF255 domain-containing protein [Tepidisphaeraceae bacterium]|nr:DUF255 domain-containing protein [Tepidisphaeraceae bacterium]